MTRNKYRYCHRDYCGKTPQSKLIDCPVIDDDFSEDKKNTKSATSFSEGSVFKDELFLIKSLKKFLFLYAGEYLLEITFINPGVLIKTGQIPLT